MAAGYYAHFVMFKGYEMTGEEENQMMEKKSPSSSKDKTGPKVSALDAIKCNPHLLWLFLSSITKYMVLFLVNGLAIYYFTYVSKNAALLATFVFAANLLGVLSSYVSKFVVAKLTAKKTVLAAYILMAVFSVIAFLSYRQTWVALVTMCLVMFMPISVLRLTRLLQVNSFSAASAWAL